jgi:hypothetical protein
MEEKYSNVGNIVVSALNKAVESQYPVAQNTVARLRRLNPDKGPTELISLLKKIYLGTVGSTGAASGASAVVPNGFVQTAVAFADLGTFLEASVLYIFALADIHGLDTEDIERRKLLVMTALLGDQSAKTVVQPLLNRTVPYWGRAIVDSIPMSSIKAANNILGKRFITKYGTKQGILVLGKQIPLFIGVGIGIAGNETFGWFITKTVNKILGPAPEHWESVIDNQANPDDDEE